MAYSLICSLSGIDRSSMPEKLSPYSLFSKFLLCRLSSLIWVYDKMTFAYKMDDDLSCSISAFGG